MRRGEGRAWSDIVVAGVSPGAVLCSASLAAAALLLGCAPPPPEAPTPLRAEGPEDPDADPEAPDARPSGSADPQRRLVWLSSERDAMERSRQERRPVLVHFDSRWCANCKRMNQETFGDPRVQAQAGRFVAVRIEATDDEDPQVSAALQKYTIINVPTLILLDSSGHEQRRFTDLVGPETLLHEIDQVR